MELILKVEKQTVNRGERTFTVSSNGKGYFAHELGNLTQCAKVFGTNEQYAHRINKMVRYGNQYTRSWKQKPFETINEALESISNQATQHIIFSN